MNIIVIGAVQSTALILEKLIEYGFNVVGVLGHEPITKEKVSGWADLKTQSQNHNLNYLGFRRINEDTCLEWTKSKKPDIIFAVGFSQLLAQVWLDMPKLGCIGFHPTNLPEGRGRAPLAWITLEKKTGSASFFLMGKGADDGPIFVQSLFEVENKDTAWSVREKIKQHIYLALDKWLPELKQGIWNPIPQNEALATYYGKRNPEDAIIDWTKKAEDIDRLIKASTTPHPGAYTYFNDSKVSIMESKVAHDLKIKGVIGRILLIKKNNKYLVQCGDGILWIFNLIFEEENKLKVGDKLGYNLEDEIYKLKKLFRNG